MALVDLEISLTDEERRIRETAGLEANAIPSYLQVVDEIPKTASEKPQERFLLERFAPDAAGVWTAAPPACAAAGS